MAETESIGISPKTISTDRILDLKAQPFPAHSPIHSERGFTLFEILIVVTILAGAIGFLVPKMIRTDSGVKKISRHILVLAKDVRNQARIKNRTFRIVFKMDSSGHSYWVESAEGSVPAKSIEQLEEESKMDEQVRPANPFQKEERFTKTQYDLPKGLFFGQIETASQKEPLTEGEVYLNFSPTGLVEAAAIQLTDKKDTNWTLVTSPLTGHVTIVQKKISLKDIKLE